LAYAGVDSLPGWPVRGRLRSGAGHTWATVQRGNYPGRRRNRCLQRDVAGTYLPMTNRKLMLSARGCCVRQSTWSPDQAQNALRMSFIRVGRYGGQTTFEGVVCGVPDANSHPQGSSDFSPRSSSI
jgi:hypothetical protein